MGKIIRLFLILLGIFLFLASLGCKKKEKEKVMALREIAAQSAGDLRILNVNPQGRTSSPREAETIVVIFDRPMVPLEALPEREYSSLLMLEPSLSGKYRWLGTRTLTFSPENRFPFATPIKVTVPRGTRSVDGYSLKEDFTWTFRTIQPQLVRHFPDDKEKWVKLDALILLIFNQPLSEEKAKDFLSLLGVSKENKETSLNFLLKHPSAKILEEQEITSSPEEALLLEPKERLKPDFTYYLEVKKGFPGREGTLGMEKDVIFSFETYKSFEFKNLAAAQGHNPYEPLKFEFSNRVTYKDFIQKIRFQPDIAIPDYYSEWDHGSDTLWISLPLQPEAEYSVWIDPELEDEFGNRLGKEIKLAFSTSSYPPSVSMTTGYGILEAYGEMKYPFYAVNSPEVFFQAANVKKDEVISLLNSPKVLWMSEKFKPSQGFFQIEKPLRLDIPRNKRQIVPIGLEELLPEKYGFLFLQLDTELADSWQRYPKVFLQVTEMGISGKFSAEGNVIWVTELKSGLPIPEAEVEIRDDWNSLRWQGKTDREGKAETPGWKILGIKSKDRWTKPQQWVFARRGKDIAFMSSEWGTGIDPYRFGIDYDWNPEPQKIQGYIFTERGIYRAGEKVHIKSIIRKREKAKWLLPSIKEIECEVQDPFQKSFYKSKFDLDSYGSFSFDLETKEDAPLGYYQIITKIPPETEKEKATTIYESFRIEAFRPAEFEVHCRTPKESFVFGEDYQAQIRANYLFGGAMGGQKASWHLRFNPSYFRPSGYEGYIFGNELDWGEWEEREESRLLASGEGILNPEGKLEIKVPLVPEKEKDSVLVTLEATVQSPSRRSISNRIQNIVHRGEYYIGLRPSTTFLKKGDELSFNIIATEPEGKLVAGQKIILKLLKREWHSVRKAGVGGRFKWISQKEDQEVTSQAVQTKNEPINVAFKPEKSGLYFLYAEGKDSRGNKITTTTSFYVTGKDYVPWERRDDDTVELVPDSENYNPGQTAKILVKSPYERAKALLTIEREFVLESRVLEIQGSSEQIEIPILSEYIPNAFVSVLLIQGRTEEAKVTENEDLGKPSFKIGYASLNVDPSEKRLEVDISKDKETYKPKDKVTVHLKVKGWKNSAAKVCLSLAVVDVGVLNLIGYQTPDPFSSFYQKKPLSVQTSETRLHLVGQREYGEKGEDVGGGGEEKEALMAMSLAEVELRGDFKSTAYWNPSLLTDDKGEASVSFTLPDNLTTFRIMAVAQTQDSQFGRKDSTFRVSKPLLLQPALPRFARMGDKFQGGVVIHNYSSKKGEAIVSVEAKEIGLLDKNNIRQISLEPGQSKEILYSFEVEKPGKAVLSFRAQMGEERDGLEITLPLLVPRPFETVALFGEIEEEIEEKVTIPADILAPESKIEVQAASSALCGLKESLDYLTDYPYLCLEQRLSSVLPYIVASKMILDFNLSPWDEDRIRKYVQNTIREIYTFQKDNGGFGLWPDSPFDSPFISCYAAFALIKAQEAGYEVDKFRLEQAATYLKNLLRERTEKGKYPYSLYSLRSWRTTLAFALYNLALLKQPEPAYAENLFREKDNLSLFGKTLLLKALHFGKGSASAEKTLLEELLNKIRVSPSQAHFEDDEGREEAWIYSSNLRTTAFILQAMIEIGSDHSLLSDIVRWLVEKRKDGHWHSTQENFYVFFALNDFYQKFEKIKPDFRAEISLAGKSLLQEIFRSQRTPLVQAQSSLSEFKAGKTLPLKIKKKGEGTLYYGARMTYFPLKKLDARDEGIAVNKKIESLDGKPLDSIKAGSLVVVTLQFAVPQERLFVVVEDPLPAGLEAVNPTFLTESEAEWRKLEEMEGEEMERFWEEFNHIELHDDRVLLFADSLPAGLHTHRYLARAVSFGLFQTPGTKAMEMYSPEVFGRTAEILIKVEQ